MFEMLALQSSRPHPSKGGAFFECRGNHPIIQRCLITNVPEPENISWRKWAIFFSFSLVSPWISVTSIQQIWVQEIVCDWEGSTHECMLWNLWLAFCSAC